MVKHFAFFPVLLSFLLFFWLLFMPCAKLNAQGGYPVLENDSIKVLTQRLAVADSSLTSCRKKRDFTSCSPLLKNSLPDFELVKDHLADSLFVSFALNAGYLSKPWKSNALSVGYLSQAYERMHSRQNLELDEEFYGPTIIELSLCYRRIDNNDSAYHYAKIGLEYYLAHQKTNRWFATLNSIVGNIHSDGGESEKAIPYIMNALSWYGQSGDTISTMILKESLANEYIKIGNYKESLNLMEEILTYYKASPNTTTEDYFYTYRNLAKSSTGLSQYTTSRAYLDSLQTKLWPSDTFIDADQLKINYFRLSGTNCITINQYDRAKAEFEEALTLANKYNYIDAENFNLFHEYNELNHTIGDWKKMLEISQKGIDVLTDSGTKIKSYSLLSYAYSYNALAHAHLHASSHNESDFQQAFLSCKKAVEIATEKTNATHTETVLETDVKRLNRNVSQLCTEAFFVLYQSSGRVSCAEEIVYINEVFKSLSIKTQLRKSEIAKASGVPQHIIESEEALIIQINDLKNKNLEADAASDTYKQQLNQIVSLSQNLQNLYDSITLVYPEYFRLMYKPSFDSVSAIQAKMEPGKTVLEFVESTQSLYVCLIKKDYIECKELGNVDSIVQLIDTFNYGIKGYYTAQNPTDSLQIATLEAYVYGATNLYKQLISPIAHLIDQQVQIIPSANTSDLSFSALLEDRPRRISFINTYKYWVKNKKISYSYSNFLYKEMEYNSQKTINQPCDFSGFAPYAQADSVHLALPYSGIEVKYGVSKFTGQNVYIDKEASLDNFLKSLACKVIHVSSHTSVSTYLDESSWLLFAEGEKLYIRDIYGLKIKAGLVFLSACESGIGRVRGQEGLMSLSRAFSYAGASCMMTTLWKINDKHTAELNTYFYDAFAQGASVSESLHIAQLKFLANNTTTNAHPYFWAGLTPIGFTNYTIK